MNGPSPCLWGPVCNLEELKRRNTPVNVGQHKQKKKRKRLLSRKKIMSLEWTADILEVKPRTYQDVTRIGVTNWIEDLKQVLGLEDQTISSMSPTECATSSFAVNNGNNGEVTGNSEKRWGRNADKKDAGRRRRSTRGSDCNIFRGLAQKSGNESTADSASPSVVNNGGNSVTRDSDNRWGMKADQKDARRLRRSTRGSNSHSFQELAQSTTNSVLWDTGFEEFEVAPAAAVVQEEKIAASCRRSLEAAEVMLSLSRAGDMERLDIPDRWYSSWAIQDPEGTEEFFPEISQDFAIHVVLNSLKNKVWLFADLTPKPSGTPHVRRSRRTLSRKGKELGSTPIPNVEASPSTIYDVVDAYSLGMHRSL